MSFPDLAYYLARRDSTEVSLYGQRVAERYDDATLAVLAEFPAIAKLELLNHHVTRFPRGLRALRYAWIGQSPGLTTLDGIEDAVGLQGLHLSSLPALDMARAFERLAELPELRYLRIDGDELRTLPEAFARLPKLAELVLGYAPNLDLEQALAMVGRVPTVRVLTFGKVAVPASIGTLRALQMLTVEAQGELPDTLGQLTELVMLDLENAACKTLPASIGNLTKLEVLRLYRSKVTALPEEIGECRSLQAIKARSCALERLPESIGKLSALRELDVYNTKLATLPKSLGALANLRSFEVSYDQPLTVPDEVYQLSLETFTGPPEMRERMVLRRLPTPKGGEVLLYDADRLPDDFGNVYSLQLAVHGHAAPIPQLSSLPCVEQVTIDTGNLADAFTRLASAQKLWRVAIFGERETLPDSIGDLAQLKTLSIDGGPWGDSDKPGVLRSLPPGLGRLTGLWELEIKRHALTEPPEVIGELAALSKLKMRMGDIRTLPRSIGKLQHLTELELWSMSGFRLPDELSECHELAGVTLHGSWQMGAIENLEILGRLPSLRRLRLLYCKANDPSQRQPWARLLAALAGSELEWLDLEDSDLGRELPDEIGGLTKLQRLTLDNIELNQFPTALRQCTGLQYVRWSKWWLTPEGKKLVKKQLPPGKWKKSRDRDGIEIYQRGES